MKDERRRGHVGMVTRGHGGSYQRAGGSEARLTRGTPSGLRSRQSGNGYGLSGSGTGAGPEPGPDAEDLNLRPDG